MLHLSECRLIQVKAGSGGASEAGRRVETKGRRAAEEGEGLSITT